MSGNVIKYDNVDYRPLDGELLAMQIRLEMQWQTGQGRTFNALMISASAANLLRAYYLVTDKGLDGVFGVGVYIVDKIDGFLLGNITRWRM